MHSRCQSLHDPRLHTVPPKPALLKRVCAPQRAASANCLGWSAFAIVQAHVTWTSLRPSRLIALHFVELVHGYASKFHI